MFKKRYLLILFMLSLIVFVVFNSSFVNNLLAQSENIFIKMQIFNLILNELQKSYVDEVEPIELLEDAIKGMLSNLDPHTTYLSRKQFENWHQKFEGFSGVGIYYNIIRNELVVVSVIEDGPADRAGIHPNDKIVAIDGEEIDDLKQGEVAKKLKGKNETTVILTMKRKGWDVPLDFTLTREKIRIKSVSSEYMISPEIGYIRLTKFTSTTKNELLTALEELQQNGMKKLILDLRNNGGGLMQAAIDVVDIFLPDKRKIVFKKGRAAGSYEAYFSSGNAPYPALPLIILLDHASASSSEIVAGAIQDWDRGLIVGEPSFGKGLVQSQIRFADNSALLITTARYYTPSGRLIQRKYHAKTKDQYYAEAYIDSIREQFKNRSEQAVYKTLQGREMYSGGGITPDIIIHSQPESVSPGIKKLYYYSRTKKPILETFADEVVLKNSAGFCQEDASNSGELQRFLDSFHLTPRYLSRLSILMKENDCRIKIDFTLKEIGELEFILKREIAFRIWGEYGRFRVKQTQDAQLQKAKTLFSEAQKMLKISLLLYKNQKKMLHP